MKNRNKQKRPPRIYGDLILGTMLDIIKLEERCDELELRCLALEVRCGTLDIELENRTKNKED